MEMIRDALSPERLENMRKLLEREDEEERRDREKWEKKIKKMAGVR